MQKENQPVVQKNASPEYEEIKQIEEVFDDKTESESKSLSSQLVKSNLFPKSMAKNYTFLLILNYNPFCNCNLSFSFKMILKRWLN